MEKKENIPANAVWNPEDSHWELGNKNAEGKPIGSWKTWHTDGHQTSEIDYNNGTPPFLFTGFHPDGTISQQGNWYGGNHWLGTYRWVKSEQPSTEPFPAGDAQKSPHVWIAEFDYITEGIYHAQRYFDKQ